MLATYPALYHILWIKVQRVPESLESTRSLSPQLSTVQFLGQYIPVKDAGAVAQIVGRKQIRPPSLLYVRDKLNSRLCLEKCTQRR